MKVKFWGVRGSIPVPGYKTVKYGGNTSCVSIESNDELIILDGGSGIRELGIELLKDSRVYPQLISIFFSHVHWDHIQGIPFFKPLFIRGNKIAMYGEKKVKTSLEETLMGQQQYPNFPISLEEIAATGANISFTDLFPRQTIGGKTQIQGIRLNHPDGVFCYKISESCEKSKWKSLVYATDTEHRNIPDPRLVDFASDAEVLIYDAQYTPEEYEGKSGFPKFDWGHSTFEFAVDTALRAGVNHLFLFHHDPEHTDEDIDRIQQRARERAYKHKKSNSGEILVDAAYEGYELVF